MIDFPASPTVGQQFTAAGVTWVWDGTKWSASGLSVAYLPLAGGTLTGTLSLAPPTGNYPQLTFSKATGSGGYTNVVYGMVGAAGRWEMDLGDGGAESGGNVGSNFVIKNYADNGSVLGTPLSINRASGQVTIPNLSAPGVIGDNRIINGDFRIDQRGVASSGGGTATGYTIDRWRYLATQAAKGNWARATFGAFGFPYALQFGSTSAYTIVASDTFYFQQPIEADMVSDFQWGSANAQPVTLSFYALSNQTGTFGGSIKAADGSRSYPFAFSLPIASTATKIAITIPGDTAGTWVMSGNAASVLVNFDLGTGATYRGPAGAWASATYNGANGTVSVVGVNGATFYVTGVKLEIGSVATPYNRQSLAKSLADCQRYFETSYNDGLAPGTVTAVGGSQNYEVTSAASITVKLVEVGYTQRKRTTPTVTFYSPVTGSSGVVRNYTAGTDVAPLVNWSGQRGFGWSLSVTAATVFNVVGQWTADAEL